MTINWFLEKYLHKEKIKKIYNFFFYLVQYVGTVNIKMPITLYFSTVSK